MNAYFPLKPINGKYPVSKEVSLGILREQVQQIAHSLRSYSSSFGQHSSTVRAILHVVTVENPVFKNNTKLLDNTCSAASNRTVLCLNELHVDEGGEIDTLSVLYEHCHSSTTPEDARVTYMHNKGSFHPTPANSNWRPALTAAVVNNHCLEPPDDTCNLCGLTFAAPPLIFTVMMPGKKNIRAIPKRNTIIMGHAPIYMSCKGTSGANAYDCARAQRAIALHAQPWSV